MEKAHRAKLQRRVRAALADTRVICLDIPDDYAFMQPELVRLLQAKVSKHLPVILDTVQAKRCRYTGLPFRRAHAPVA